MGGQAEESIARHHITAIEQSFVNLSANKYQRSYDNDGSSQVPRQTHATLECKSRPCSGPLLG